MRLLRVGPNDPAEDYPRLVRSHGQIPPVSTSNDYEIDPSDDDE